MDVVLGEVGCGSNACALHCGRVGTFFDRGGVTSSSFSPSICPDSGCSRNSAMTTSFRIVFCLLFINRNNLTELQHGR